MFLFSGHGLEVILNSQTIAHRIFCFPTSCVFDDPYALRYHSELQNYGQDPCTETGFQLHNPSKPWKTEFSSLLEGLAPQLLEGVCTFMHIYKIKRRTSFTNA
ncbi:MAG: hypothetical protein CL912_25615 [Deltaproteobacteria bacterium]|nr:hypothetical protein [Deltaproteobacteria bacterium]